MTETYKMATVSQLLTKPARFKVLEITLGEEKVCLKLRSISSKAYDDLLSQHPPTKAQKAEGSTYNIDTFAPALISLCVIDPEINAEDATALWTSPEWSRGELLDLFFAAVEVNNKGLDVPTSAPA